MRLDVALVKQRLVESRQEAQDLIARGAVFINGVLVTKQTKDVTDGDKLTLTSRRAYVSRGGEKLEGVLYDLYTTKEATEKALQDTVALDIGSSTGGFTDCLLKHGVKKVVAVDVGSNQLHASLLANPAIELHEQTDIRKFTSPEVFDYIVADLSFIALELVLEAILSFRAHPGTIYILLIKPQFEVGKGNTKKGIVKDNNLVASVCKNYQNLLESHGLRDSAIFPCHIQGGDGNQEYFIVAKR